MSISTPRVRAVLPLVTVLAVAITGAGCKHEEKELDPRFADGAIFLSVSDAQGRDLGGIGKVTYLTRGKKQLRSDTAAFSGTQPVPVHVVVENEDLDLVSIQLLGSNSKPIFIVSADRLSSWIPAAKKGVDLSIRSEREGNMMVPTTASFAMRLTPPPVASPELKVQSMPLDTLDGVDVSSALNTLRFSASATESYHKDLTALVAKSGALDAAHLALALDATYYTQKSVDELSGFLSRVSQDPLAVHSKESWMALEGRARENFRLAGAFAPYVNALLDANLAKVTNLGFENGVALLERLIPLEKTEVGTVAFRALTAQVKLAGEQKLALAHLATAKRNFTIDRELILDWFQTDANHSVKALAEQLGAQRTGEYRNSILYGALAECQTISVSDLAALAALSWGESKNLLTKGAPLITTLTTAELLEVMAASSPDIAMGLFYAKVSDLTPRNMALIGARLSGEIRVRFVVDYLAGLKTLSTDDFSSLVALLEGELRDQTILDWLPKVTERDSVHLAQLFGLLTPSARATHLLRFIDALPSLSTEALIALSQAAPERRSFILLAYLDRLSDFTPANAVKIARFLTERDRDSVLLLVMERTKTISADDLQAVAQAAYEKTSELLKKNLAKVTPLTSQGVAQLARFINDYSKDEFILQGLDRLGALATEDVLILANASYNRGQHILVNFLDRISDLTVENTIKLARRVSGGEQDKVVKFWFTKNTKVTTQELLQLAGATYYGGSALLVEQIDKVSDLTVANAITIVSRLGGGEQDRFLLKAVGLVTDLSSANLLQLANRAYSARDAVIQKGVDRLAQHP